jgi:hypothetical protein
MVAVSSDRHPQPTTSLLMIILKVSCRTSSFSGPQRQFAAGARDVSGDGMAPGVIMRPGAGQRWRPCRDCVVAREICRQGQAVRDVAGSDQQRADQRCSEMFDGPWDPVFGPSGHHRCVDLGGDVRQAHPAPLSTRMCLAPKLASAPAAALVSQRVHGLDGQLQDAPAPGRLGVARGADAAVDRHGSRIQVDVCPRERPEFLSAQASQQRQHYIGMERGVSEASRTATAWSRVGDRDGLPPLPSGASTSDATLRPTRSAAWACRASVPKAEPGAGAA